MAEHNVLTGSSLHEPKGVAAAGIGSTYIADGAGSGTWKSSDSHIAIYVAFDSATPAYSHTTTTSWTVMDATYVPISAKDFTGDTSPNARLTYTGTETVMALIQANGALSQSSGGIKTVEISIYKNGVMIPGTHTITSTATTDWHQINLNTMVSLATSDYIEFFMQSDSAHTTEMATSTVTVKCFPS